jgi:UDP-glucuronate decarboxylase
VIPDTVAPVRIPPMPNSYGIKNSHVFITGGAGFIATTLAARLIEDNQVTLYDNLHNDALKNTTIKDHPNLRFIKGDVLDPKFLAESIDPRVEYVIHCAAIAGVDTVLKNPLRTLEVNLLGVFNALKACVGHPKLLRFVDFSTSEVYGNCAGRVDERHINPSIAVGEARWTYSISKLAAEFVAHSYHRVHHVPTVTIRPFNVYGPNQVGVGAIHNFVQRSLKNQSLTVHNEGTQIRAWCYIDDFVHGVLLAMTRAPASGRCYNIGSPRETLTTLALAKLVQRTVGSTAPITFKALDYPDVEVRIPDIRAARTELGYEPQVDIEEGVRRTVEWYKAHPNVANQSADAGKSLPGSDRLARAG